MFRVRDYIVYAICRPRFCQALLYFDRVTEEYKHRSRVESVKAMLCLEKLEG